MKKILILFIFLILLNGCSTKTPAVKTFYQLNKRGNNQGFKSGFDVKLPKINSEKAGAEEVNKNFLDIRNTVEAYFNENTNLGSFNERIIYDYKVYKYDGILSILIRGEVGWRASEYWVNYNCFYYDYINDKALTNHDIIQKYSISNNAVIRYITEKNGQKPASDEIYFYKNNKGELYAVYTISEYTDSQEIIRIN